MKLTGIFRILPLALIASFLLAACGASGGESNANSEAARKRAAENNVFVSAMGRVEPGDEVIELTAPPSAEGARVAQLLVKEGDEVAENQIVAVLDGQDKLRATLREADERIRIAESRLAQIRAGAKAGDIEANRAAVRRLEAELGNAQIELRRAETPTAPGVVPAPEYVAIKKIEVEIENARQDLRRAEKLIENGDISRAEFEDRRTLVRSLERDAENARATLRNLVNQRRLAVQTLRRDLEKQQATLESVAEVRPTDVEAAEAEVAEARAARERAFVDLADTNVRALTAGRVLEINARPGERIGDDGILELAETEQMYVVAEVFEADIGKIRIDQPAEMTIRASGEKLAGTVAEIGQKIGKRELLDTDPVADVDARVVEVKIRLSQEDSRKVRGLTNLRVDARIRTA